MSEIHSIFRGLPGTQVTVVPATLSDLVPPGSVEIVPPPNPSKRRLANSGFTASSEEVGNDFAPGMINSVNIVAPNDNTGDVSYKILCVTAAGERYLLQEIPNAVEGNILPGEARRFNLCTLLKDDEHLALEITGAAETSGSRLNVFSSFLDYPASLVGRERVVIPAVVGDPMDPDPGPWVEVIPAPPPGKMHVQTEYGSAGDFPNISAVAEGVAGASLELAVEDNGTIRHLDTAGTAFGGEGSNFPFFTSLREGQRILARSVENGPAVILSSYLIVPDPKIGQPGNSA